MRSVSAHSSATGMSPVPALTSATGLRRRARAPASARASRSARARTYFIRASLAQTVARLVRVEPRDEHVLPGARELARDAGDLLGRLACAEDHLRRALPQRAVVVDRRVPEVGKRQVLELRHRVVDARRPPLHALEELAKSLRDPWRATRPAASMASRTAPRPTCPSPSPLSSASPSAQPRLDRRAELVRDDGPVVASRPFAVVAAFAALVWLPVVGYFVAFHGDWSYLYVVPWQRVPSAVDLGLVLARGRGGRSAASGSRSRPVRKRRIGPGRRDGRRPGALAVVGLAARATGSP